MPDSGCWCPRPPRRWSRTWRGQSRAARAEQEQGGQRELPLRPGQDVALRGEELQLWSARPQQTGEGIWTSALQCSVGPNTKVWMNTDYIRHLEIYRIPWNWNKYKYRIVLFAPNSLNNLNQEKYKGSRNWARHLVYLVVGSLLYRLWSEQALHCVKI